MSKETAEGLNWDEILEKFYSYKVINRKNGKSTYVPAKLYIENQVAYSYTCEATLGEANIYTTKIYKGILYKSMASNELVVHVLNMKYHYVMPLYRFET